MKNNPYIQKITDFDHIWTEQTSDMLAYRGTWKSFLGHENLMVEIGTGMGNFFSQYASEHRDTACVGIELKYKRLYRTYEKCVEKDRPDVVLLRVYGQSLGQIFGPGEIDALYLLFSDPWPKKAHAKNRVIQDAFLQDVASVLSPSGKFFIKTDDDAYAAWIQEHLDRSSDLIYTITMDEDPNKTARPDNATEFETIWRKKGKKITAFVVEKSINPQIG